MPPKSVNEVSFTQSDINVLTSVLLHVPSFSSDWAAVKDDLGISLAGNAQRDFRKVLAKLGLKLAGGVITENGVDAGDPAAPATPVRTSGTSTKTPKKRVAATSTPDSSKKRKVAGQNEADGANANIGGATTIKEKVDAPIGQVTVKEEPKTEAE